MSKKLAGPLIIMRIRRSVIAVALALSVVLIGGATCGTLVQVVDGHGTPVPGAHVQLIYPSFNGPSATTGSDGHARLRDVWFTRPLCSMMPAWVWVRTDVGTWHFDYPPAPVVHLDPTRLYSPPSWAIQPDAAAGEPKAARR